MKRRHMILLLIGCCYMYDTKTLLDNLETRELVLGNSTTTGATSWRHWRNQSTQCARATRRKGVDLCASFHRTAPPCGQPVTRPGCAHSGCQARLHQLVKAATGWAPWWEPTMRPSRPMSPTWKSSRVSSPPSKSRSSPTFSTSSLTSTRTAR